MTTLAAIQGKGWCVLGADSRSSDDDGFAIDIPGGKIFQNNNIIFAGAGSVRGINILEHDFIAPKFWRTTSEKYVTRILIPKIRRAFADAGYEINKQDSAVVNDNIWLIVVGTDIYRIDEDYSWERCNEGLYVAGSGEAYAIGALDALGGSQAKSPQEAEVIIRKAIAIASRWDSYTGGKINTRIVTNA